MKKILKTACLALLLGHNQQGFSQANHWAIAPNVSFNAFMGLASNYSTPGLNLTGCVTPDKKLSVISNSSGLSYFAFGRCGVYNYSGAAVGSGGTADVFAIPGLCNHFYSVGWENVWGPPHTNKLVLRLLDASTPSAVSVSSATDIMYGNQGISVAVTPLKADASRTIYISEDVTLRSVTIAPDGTAGALTTVATLPAILDTRTNMEVSPDGKSIIMLTLGSDILRYNISSGIFTTVASLPDPGITTVSGFEFVPGFQFGTGAHDRLYVSYHYWHVPGGYGKLVYYDLDNLSTGASPAVTSFPSGTLEAGFGYSEIERAKNGKLYLAYNSNYWTNASGYYVMPVNGTLYELDPVSGAMSAVSIGSTPVSINTDPNHWGYYIQNQIDGENYNYTNWNTGPASFTLNKKGNEDPFTSPIGFVPTIWFCNDDTTKLILRATINGYISSKQIVVEKGTITWDPMDHTPFFSPSGTSYSYGPVSTSALTDSVNLLALFPALLGYYGDIRVSYITDGCGGSKTTRKLFILRSAKALINFSLQGPPGAVCPGGAGTVQARKIRSDAFGVHGTVTAPFCDSGWLGASSATLLNGTSTLSGATAADSYRVSVAGPGLSISKAYPSMPTALAFSALADGYFILNYASAKGGPVFKITAFVKTEQCDTVSAYSYFKIIDGGAPGQWWKTAEPGALQLEEVHVFPNPAHDKVHVSWHSSAATPAAISIVDVMGRTLIQKELPQTEGQNDLDLDVSILVPGLYHYRLKTSNGDYSGRILKE